MTLLALQKHRQQAEQDESGQNGNAGLDPHSGLNEVRKLLREIEESKRMGRKRAALDEWRKTLPIYPLKDTLLEVSKIKNLNYHIL